MSGISNGWLTPFQRSFQQIRSKLIERLRTEVPELTDFSEGNIFILILSLYSSIAEVLHYYIDNMARETFFSTARKYSSLQKHVKLIDYHIKSAIPSMVDVVISKSDGTILTGEVEIPANTIFTSSDGQQWVSTRTVTWYNNTYGVTVPLAQKTIQPKTIFGIVTSSNFIIQLGDLGSGNYYVEGSMVLEVTNAGVTENWELVETFAYSGPNDKHYKVEVDDNLDPYITFGNNKFGGRPATGSTIAGSFYITNGAAGNIAQNTLISVPNSISQQVGSVTITNPLPGAGGSNYESFDMIKDHAPLSIKTLGVAITKDDYEAIARLAPGVDKASVNYQCGKYLEIYITPDGGGVASSSLVESTYTYVLGRKILTSQIRVMPAYVADIYLTATITGRKSFSDLDITDQVSNALMQAYNYNTSDIGKSVRLSDLYALIDNLSMVDYLTIDNLYVKPWAVKLGTTTTELNITYINITNVVEPMEYILTYVDASFPYFSTLHVQSGRVFSIGLGVLVAPDDTYRFSIRIDNPISGSYVNGNSWSITAYPNNVDQALEGEFVIPVFSDKANIALTINETV